jgi:endoglucanase
MKHRVALAAAAAAGLVVAGGVAVLAGTASAATAGCSVSYTIASQWQGGFQGAVTLTNLGDPLANWTLRFSFPDVNQKVTQGWSATWSQSGAAVTAVNMGYNGAVATNGTVSMGFIGAWGSVNPMPTSFTVNGVTCTGGVSTPPSSQPPSSRPPSSAPPSSPPPAGAAPALHVSGNHLVTSTGATYRLLGVNRSGGEFACIQGNGMWNGPMDQASIDAMKTWKVRTVRVPLNEECWVGTSDVPAGGPSGSAYQANVKAYVNLLLSSGITPILEMHWNYGQYTGPSAGCSDVKATCQKPMPDAQYAPTFWTGVANAYKDNRVVFDLFNEPYPSRATGSAASGWACWRDGGTCAGIPYQVAGFQSLLNAVRATGNTNVVMIGGLEYSNDLSQWLQFKPTDSTGNLMAFAHVYNFNACVSSSCWDSNWGPVAAQVPLALSEIGENDCNSSFINTVMNWADSHGIGYLGWTWNNWDCSTGPALITDYNGTATNFGAGFKAHLLTQ